MQMAFPLTSSAENFGAEFWSRIFLTVLPEKQPSVTSIQRYDLVAQIHFLISVADIFNSFLKFFQSEEPLSPENADGKVHQERTFGKQVFENHLAYKELGISEQTRREIGKSSQEKQRKFVLGTRSFLIDATKHLNSNLPLDNIILRSSKALKPGARSEDWSLKAIKILAKKLKVIVDLDKKESIN